MADGAEPRWLTEVPAQKPARSPCAIAFVGEAPGEHEVEKQRPFVGPSGRVFDALCRSANIDRAACFVGNVYNTKLTENLVSKERALRGAGWGEWHAAQVTRLSAELRDAQPTLVVPMGGTALSVLAGTTAISKVRGNLLYSSMPQFPRYKLMPTLHPAAVLRQWELYHTCVGDFVKALFESETPEIKWPVRRLNIAPSIAEVEAYVPVALGAPLLSCDIETMNFGVDNGIGQIRGISFAHSEEEGIYVPFIKKDGISRSYWFSESDEKKAWLACKAILESPVPKLGQNFTSYDVPWLLRRMGIRVRGYREELRLLHKALYPELPASLLFMASVWSSQGAWKAWVSHGGSSKERGEKRDE